MKRSSSETDLTNALCSCSLPLESTLLLVAPLAFVFFQLMEGALIVARAEEIRRLGKDIGLFEWLAWGAINQRRVLMLFGDSIIDLFEWFAPSIHMDSTSLPCRVVAVRMTGMPGQYRSSVPERQGLGVAHAYPAVSHYVIGVAASSALSHECYAGHGLAPQCAKKAALRVGWMIKDTAAQGDCGPDVMAHFQGLERNETSWQLIRNQIADFLLAAADDTEWRDVFGACSETPPPPPAEPAAPAAGPTAALVVDDEPEDMGVDASRLPEVGIGDYDLE